jgi:predicted MFS family arabinose efflux permease
MGVILLVAAPMSVLRSFFLAGYTASVPALVGRSQIARANSIFEAVYSMGYIVGPAAAGLLATAIGPGNTLVIDAASFGLSSMGLFLVRRDLRAPIDRPRAHLLVEIREGIEFIVHRPVLRAAILFWGCTSVISAPLVAALTVHVIRDLRLSSSVLGLLLAAFGVGTVAGALVLSRASNQRAVAPFLFGGNLAAASGLVALAGIDVVPVMIGLAALIGVAQSASFLTYLTMRTTYTPDELLGRVGSTARTISLGLQPVGLLIGGAAIDLISGSTTIVVMGVAIAAVTLAFFALSPLRHATLQPTAR